MNVGVSIAAECQRVIEKLENRMKSFSLRERILLLVLVMLAIYFIWSTLLFGYILPNDSQIEQELQEIRRKESVVSSQIKYLKEGAVQNIKIDLTKRMQVLSEDNQGLQDKIVAELNGLVTPKDMAKIVRTILEKTEGLELILLESTDSKLLFDDKNKPESHMIHIFDHGLKLELSGNYFQTWKFLEALENQKSKMLWGELAYEVELHPKAHINIHLRTLGLEEAWIGV